MLSPFTPRVLQGHALSLSSLSYGLTIDSLVVNLAEGKKRDLLVGYLDPAEHDVNSKTGRGRGFINQVVGRYANRLPQNDTTFAGKKLKLAGNNGVFLHGGAAGFDVKEWKEIERSTSALFPENDLSFPASPDVNEALYRYVSPAGEEGFPLTLEVEGLVFAKKSKSTVGVVLRAKIVEDGAEGLDKGTPVNLTVHWGFNLSSFDGEESESILDHKLWIDSDSFTHIDGLQLPTGEIASSASSNHPFNFSKGTISDPSTHRTIAENYPSDGIDHNIILRRPSSPVTPQNSKPQVVLTSPDSKVSLEFRTNQASVETYTAAGFNGKYSRKALHCPPGSEKKGYPQYGAVFLEFHYPLASFLHKKLSDAAGTDGILKPGEVYENWVEVDVLVRC
ncbi:galactose mutarotase-like protein [Meredithblackwellia eburnea MCA 4105]